MMQNPAELRRQAAMAALEQSLLDQDFAGEM
jgi:hypothetical protein